MKTSRSALIGRNSCARKKGLPCGRGPASRWIRFNAPSSYLTIVLAGLFFHSASLVAAPYTPSDDTQVIERLPTANNRAARELRGLHATLRQSPENLALALHVARRDVEVARAEGDPRYNGYAEAALSRWINLTHPPREVLVMRATLRQSRHDFAGALDDLDQVVAIDPRNAQALLTRAVIFQVQGNYAQALDDCLALRSITENLVAEICTANVQALHGRARESYQGLEAALARSAPNLSEQLRLWALTVMAETAARLDETDAAERHFRHALSLGIDDAYLLGTFADFLLDQGRAEEVRSLLANKTRVDPLLLRLALAEAQLGAPTLSQRCADLAERFAASRRRGDLIHLREEARFALHLLRQPDVALEIADANWAAQREPWDARLVLEAALAAGRPEGARAVLAWLATSRMEDIHLRRLVDRVEGTVR